nr:hypothetical protein [Halorhabdus rudnickae]
MARRANPAFAVSVVAIPLAALGYALTIASIQQHTYVHVIAGVLWTGIDAFIGAVLGPVIGGVQGLFQLLLILDMVYLRYGGFLF